MKIKLLPLAVALTAALANFDSAAHAQTNPYTAINLGTLGGNPVWAVPNGVSDAGQVTGLSFASTSIGGQEHAFLYSNGSMTDLGTLGGWSSIGFGVNSFGQVAGQAATLTGEIHAFLSSNGSMTDLGVLYYPNNTAGDKYGTFSEGRAINKAGQIVGDANTPYIGAMFWYDPGIYDHAFIYSNGTMIDLFYGAHSSSIARGINDPGQITGSMQIGDFNSPRHAFVVNAGGTLIDLGTLSGTFSDGNAINNAGEITGCATLAGDDGNLRHAFLYSNGNMADLGTLAGAQSAVYPNYSEGAAINNLGQVVGISSNVDPATHNPVDCAFLYSNGSMIDVNTLVSIPDVHLIEATGINDKGEIVAIGWDGLHQLAFLLVPPGTPTPVGSNVVTDEGSIGAASDIAATFAAVTAAGSTSVSQIDPNAAGQLPAGYELSGSNLAFDISTTATYSGTITICFAGLPLDDATFAAARVFHNAGSGLVDVTSSKDAASKTICATVTSLSPFVIAGLPYHATIQPPINSDGSSIFTVKRGVAPIKFALSLGPNPTCTLPAATIAVTRLAGANPVPVNEAAYLMPADTGSTFRIDSCQYIYNLNSSALGAGTYRVDIKLGSKVVGSGSFQLQ